MNEEIKARWVAALRSGQYIQGIGYLLKDKEYCCLGVLCDLAVQDGIILPPMSTYIASDDVYTHKFDDEAYELPVSVILWAELVHKEDSVWDDWTDPLSELVDRNDNGDTFDEIADFIEREL